MASFSPLTSSCELLSLKLRVRGTGADTFGVTKPDPPATEAGVVVSGAAVADAGVGGAGA